MLQTISVVILAVVFWYVWKKLDRVIMAIGADLIKTIFVLDKKKIVEIDEIDAVESKEAEELYNRRKP